MHRPEELVYVVYSLSGSLQLFKQKETCGPNEVTMGYNNVSMSLMCLIAITK